MNSEHAISDDVFNAVIAALENDHRWFVYNTLSYLLEKADVKFFRTEHEAKEWAFENNSKTEAYRTIPVNSFTDLYNEIKYGQKLDIILNHPKTQVMNPKNLDYLKENLRFMGFGDKLNADLEKNIQQGFPEFVLKTQSEFGSKKIDAALLFKKSDQTDMYFFNRFDAHLQHRNDPDRDVQQTFYLNKGHGVTLKEAFNLLDGRAVFKEMSGKEGKYNAWIQLDFKEKEENGNYKTKQYHQNYGYDLEASLKAVPIKEFQSEQQRERLLMSLQKGNVQSVSMMTDGREQMFFVEANPQYKTVTVYDSHMKMLNKEQRAELIGQPHINKNQVNNQETKIDDPGKTIERSPDHAEKPEVKKPDKEESKTEKHSAGPAEKTASAVIKKKDKNNEVKALLPQKEKSNAKKGQRV